MDRNELISRAYRFINGIGIEIEERALTSDTFLPGITISAGKLVVDPGQLKYPGDLLHEAGHIALIPLAKRGALNGDATGNADETKGYEMGVLIWSFLAAQEAGIPPEIVFHTDGYKGDSDWLLENFRNKKFIGFPLLQWMGIARMNREGQPEVIRWMRE